MNTEEDEFKRIEREAKRRAQDDDDDDTQVYADTLSIVYQRGFADGEKAAQQQAEPVAWNAGVPPMWPQQKEGETFSVAYIAQPEQQAEPPPEWEDINNILDEYGLQAIAFVAEWKAAQRPWQGLTDAEIWSAVDRIGTSDSDVNPYQILNNARAIEAKLKEKNT